MILMNVFRLGTLGMVLKTEPMQNAGKIQMKEKKEAKIIFRDGVETF